MDGIDTGSPVFGAPIGEGLSLALDAYFESRQFALRYECNYLIGCCLPAPQCFPGLLPFTFQLLLESLGTAA